MAISVFSDKSPKTPPGNIIVFYCEDSQTILVCIGLYVVHFIYASMHDELQLFVKIALHVHE